MINGKQDSKKSKIPLMIITNNDIIMCPICYNYQVKQYFYLVHMLLVTLCSKIIKNCHLCRRKIPQNTIF